MLTDRATRRCGFLRFVTTIDALRRSVAGGIALMARPVDFNIGRSNDILALKAL